MAYLWLVWGVRGEGLRFRVGRSVSTLANEKIYIVGNRILKMSIKPLGENTNAHTPIRILHLSPLTHLADTPLYSTNYNSYRHVEAAWTGGIMCSICWTKPLLSVFFFFSFREITAFAWTPLLFPVALLHLYTLMSHTVWGNLIEEFKLASSLVVFLFGKLGYCNDYNVR